MKNNSILHETGLFCHETDTSFHAIVAQTRSMWCVDRPKFWDAISLELVCDVLPMDLAGKLAALLSQSWTADDRRRLATDIPDEQRLSSAERRFAEGVSFRPLIPWRTTGGTTSLKSLAHLSTTVLDDSDECFLGLVRYGYTPLLLLLTETAIILCGASHNLRTALHDGLYFEIASYVASFDQKIP